MKLSIVIVLAFAWIPCAGCSANDAPRIDPLEQAMHADPTHFAIELVRKPCASTGAEYSITIRGDGAVTYEGIHNVRVVGKRTATISADALRELVAGFERAEVSTLASVPARCAIEAPCTTLIVRLPDREIRLHDCAITNLTKEHAQFHSAMNGLATSVDEAAHSARWVQDYSDAGDVGYTDSVDQD